MVIRSGSGKYLQFGVLGCQALKKVAYLLLCHGTRQVILTLIQTVSGDIGIQIIKTIHAYAVKHGADVLTGLRKILETCHYSLMNAL